MTEENDSTSIIDLTSLSSSTVPSEQYEAKLREAYRINAARVEEEQPSFVDSVEEFGLPSNEEAPSYFSPHGDATNPDPHTQAYQDKIVAALEEASSSTIDPVDDDHDDITPV